VLVGSARLLSGAGIATSALDPVAAELSAQGKTPVLAAVDGVPAGVLAVADPVTEDSAAAIAALHRLGVEVVMLTGDNARCGLQWASAEPFLQPGNRSRPARWGIRRWHR
jgi:P-type Cu+ transporter